MSLTLPLEIVIATKNPGKIVELRDSLSGIPATLRYLHHYPHVIEVAETGATFEENAVLKARGYALQTGVWAIADDSGLEVEAIGGAPGVYSARYGGNDLSFAQRIELVLDEMSNSPTRSRRARFVCVMALADAAGNLLCSGEGIVDGSIVKSPRGTQGFGYDPIFVPDGYSETFAELPASVKRSVSHRARASLTIMRYLLDINGI